MEDVGFVSQNPTILQHVRAGATRLLTDHEVMEVLWTAITHCKNPKPSPVIAGPSDTRNLSCPGVHSMWVRDLRYALYYNLESESKYLLHEANYNLKTLLVKVERDSSLLDQPQTENVVRQELGKSLTQHMPNAENMDNEQTALETL